MSTTPKHYEIDPIPADVQGLVILDGTGIPLIVTDEMDELNMAEYLDGLTSLQLSALAGRLTVLRYAVEDALGHKPRDPRRATIEGVAV